MMTAIDELRQRVEAMEMQLGIMHRTFNDVTEWVDGTLYISVPNLPDEGDGGYWKEFATFTGPDALDNLDRMLNGLEATAKARKLAKKYTQEVVSMRKPFPIPGQIQLRINERLGFIEALRDEFGIEEDTI